MNTGDARPEPDTQINLTDTSTWPESIHERRRQRLAELEREQQHMFAVMAAIIRKYGEDNGQGHKVVRISDADLENVMADAPIVTRWDSLDEPGMTFGVRP